MNDTVTIDTASLVDEVQRYLAAVDSFRAEHCEPTWLPELALRRTVPQSVPARVERAAKQSH
ncbi:MAG TPA: hypothetical protein VIG93_07875 [Gaiellaceae bacterium]